MADPVFFNRIRVMLSTFVSSMRDDAEMAPVVEKLKETLLALDTLMQQHSGGEEALKSHLVSRMPGDKADRLQGIRPGSEEKKNSAIDKKKVKRDEERNKKKKKEEPEDEDEA